MTLAGSGMIWRKKTVKKVIVIIGPNGVGKSTTAEILLEKCPRSAYVDADWCRAINPFPFTKETKAAVTENIFCLFRNYLLCSDIDRVIFPYAFHGERKNIFDEVIRRLQEENIEFKLHILILKCSLDENIKRAVHDRREEERIRRGIENTFHFYDAYETECPVIDTTELTPEQAAEEIRRATGF